MSLVLDILQCHEERATNVRPINGHFSKFCLCQIVLHKKKGKILIFNHVYII